MNSPWTQKRVWWSPGVEGQVLDGCGERGKVEDICNSVNNKNISAIIVHSIAQFLIHALSNYSFILKIDLYLYCILSLCLSFSALLISVISFLWFLSCFFVISLLHELKAQLTNISHPVPWYACLAAEFPLSPGLAVSTIWHVAFSLSFAFKCLEISHCAPQDPLPTHDLPFCA